MKKLLLLIFMLSFSIMISQEKFKITKDGINTNSIVINVDSLSAKQLYLKTINWIKDNYNSPDDVIKTKFENEKVRFQGIDSDSYVYHVLGSNGYNDVKYMIEISFKDGKYKFSIINLEVFFSSSEYTSGGWTPINFSDFWKKNGKIKKAFRDTPKEIENMLNGLLISHYNYLRGNKGEEDW